jgi:hypothetical protein
MVSAEPHIAPTTAEYLRRAALARQHAKNAPQGTLQDGFLKVAEGWERIAKTARDINNDPSAGGQRRGER